MNLIQTVTHIPEGILCLCSTTGIVSAETEKKKSMTLNNKSWSAFTEIRIKYIVRVKFKNKWCFIGSHLAYGLWRIPGMEIVPEHYLHNTFKSPDYSVIASNVVISHLSKFKEKKSAVI